jgi:hypothetical protein
LAVEEFARYGTTVRIALPVKLMASYLLVAGLIVAPSLWLLRRSLQASLEEGEARELRPRVEAVRDRLVAIPDDRIDHEVRDLASLVGLRVTYIDRTGRVLSDSDVPPQHIASVENHHDRPEVMEALAGGYGHARRLSNTLGAELIYGAVPLPQPGSSGGAPIRAAMEASEKSGLPTEMAFAPPGALGESAVKAQLVPLPRPAAPPLWLLVVDTEGLESEARGPEAVHRLLHSAEVVLERLWDGQPALRPTLAQLRLRLDEAAHAAGRPEAVGVEPVDAVALLERCVEEVRALHPTAAAELVLDAKASCRIAESAGLAARALRLLLGGALRALLPGRPLEVTLAVAQTEVKLLVDGGAPGDLKPIQEMARALGGDVGRVPHREREAAWLTLPRA